MLNSLLYLCVERGIIEHNCLSDINYRQFAYKAESTDIMPYTKEERKLIIQLLSNDDFYSLAIKLDFHLVLRIGELEVLKWIDIRNKYNIRIQRFVDEKKVIEDIKGHAKEGKCLMPLTQTAKEIWAKVKQINPDSDFMFVRDGQPLSRCTFNRRLKKCCEELGINYRSREGGGQKVGLRKEVNGHMYTKGQEETALKEFERTGSIQATV
jgi:integrase